MDINNTTFLVKLFNYYKFDINQYIGHQIILRGHINTTYILYFDIGPRVKRFIVQQINTNVFKEPKKLMDNIDAVTTFGKNFLKENNKKNYLNSILRIYKTKNKKSYFIADDGSYWRVYHYIENSVTYDISKDPKIFYEAGKVIGEFHNMLAKFEASTLNIVIKDFHNTIVRYQNFTNALNKASDELVASCLDEINFFKKHQNITKIIQEQIDNHLMPLRVTHNDTKFNNLMFQYKTRRGLCLIDFDTIMPGCLCFDFGDFIRSACNSASEDCKDLSQVVFQKDLCLVFAQGFLEKLKDSISEIEVKHLIIGAIDMTYECGLRFLTDYLENNIYFKVDYPEHNLVRCKTQIKMCQQMLDVQQELEQEVLKIYQNLS